jgi:cardiolipin synthase A/B
VLLTRDSEQVAFGLRPKARPSALVSIVLLAGLLIAASGCGLSGAPTSAASTNSDAVPRSTSAGSRPTTRSDPTKRPAIAAATWSLVIEPNDGMQPIYSLMSSARHELDMTMYELADTQAVEILESDAARGVTVRVILDQDYSGGSVNAAAYSELTSHGVQVHWGPPGTIFHQKTITVDDQTSAIMTLNLTSQYYSTTRDFAVVTTDHADVEAIEQVFDADWTDPSPPQSGSTGTNLVWSPGAEEPILDLIESARHSLLIENEEMDDPDIANALEAAAGRGIKVEVVMTYSSSWLAEFEALIDAGVKVSTYSSDAPLYIHAKVIVADGTRAFIGSQNFSDASLNYNRELGLITSDPTLVVPVTDTLTSDFAGATQFAAASTHGSSPRPPPVTGTTSTGPWCQASAAPANDGYAGDYEVYVHSNQPGEKATASDAGDTYSYYTDESGYAVIDLWHTSPGETIRVTVGGAECSTAA